jgi:hypothetical protein
MQQNLICIGIEFRIIAGRVILIHMSMSYESRSHVRYEGYNPIHVEIRLMYRSIDAIRELL